MLALILALVAIIGSALLSVAFFKPYLKTYLKTPSDRAKALKIYLILAVLAGTGYCMVRCVFF